MTNKEIIEDLRVFAFVVYDGDIEGVLDAIEVKLEQKDKEWKERAKLIKDESYKQGYADAKDHEGHRWKERMINVLDSVPDGIKLYKQEGEFEGLTIGFSTSQPDLQYQLKRWKEKQINKLKQ